MFNVANCNILGSFHNIPPSDSQRQENNISKSYSWIGHVIFLLLPDFFFFFCSKFLNLDWISAIQGWKNISFPRKQTQFLNNSYIRPLFFKEERDIS